MTMFLGVLCIFNAYNNSPSNMEWIQELGIQDTAKIQYMCIDMEFAHAELKVGNGLGMDIPVVIMRCYDNSYTPRGTMYEFLSEYKNTEKVILDYFQSPDYDKEEICKEIHKYLSDVDIYTVEFADGEHYLEKCQ